MEHAVIAKRLAGASNASSAAALERRDFLRLAALAGGGLAVYASGLDAQAAEGAKPSAPPPADPSPFVRILPDNTVEIRVNRLDFGQGALTALPMLVAEELDVDWKQVRSTLAPAGDPYKDPVFGIQMTGGSSAVPNSWQQHREIGAATRQMLVAAAAEQWKVAPAECKTAAGFVSHGGRKASYASLAEAAAKQPVPKKVTLKAPADYRLIGKGQGRIDAVATAKGQKRYGIDMRLPNQKVALLMRAPTFGGQVASFDASAAKAIKGVADVIEVPTDRGGRGLAIIASGYWPAKQARDALKVQWTAGGTTSSDALLASYRDEARQPKMTALRGDVAALSGAAKKISADYEFPFLAHAPMEPLNATFEVKKDRATVWAGSQFQTIDQLAVAETLGLKPEQVTLNTLPAGGGFGRRAVPTSDYLREAAAIAKAWAQKEPGVPIKVMWSREDDIKGGYYRPMHVHRVEIGLDEKGKVLAWDHAIVGQSILKGTPFESFLVKDGIDGTMTEGVVENHYGMPMRLRVSHPEAPVPVLWWRSVGHTHTGFVMETLADEVARAAGEDPVAWRLARLDPAKHGRHIAALKLAVDRSGYGKPLPTGHAWGVAVHESFGSVVAYVVDVSMAEGRPKVHAVTAGVHANQVVNPTGAEAQIQGGAVFGIGMTQPGFAITLKDGVVEQSQFTDYPPVRIGDAPKVAVHFVPSTAAPTGLGEPGVPPIAPAIANAVAALTGKRLRKLPFDDVA
ncbi:MAG TPA: xanthine dehydrogenase family protein molybdopterin-binding subunit [Methylibium sp.]|uniref:xanthine dehydrogenase family protein molybdopterin-binding subunit n=1 Tax=Methylibium sp. TaxID=2067992 RepID=UPI002DB7B893|nr:xanthine dehydrogenase family protein molybdopterin-binding subunit [Methylibium sp.]HEU4457553.1 xanthine dehydrogenase family protein molybdopterin-binding subunit [Methylibium sp.]